MKHTLLLSIATICTAIFLAACDKPAPVTGQPQTPAEPVAPAGPAASLDATKLLEALASAGPEEKSRAGKAAQALQAEAFPAALEALEKLLAEGHLTTEQKEVVSSYIAKLKAMPARNP